jgi:hypothetical protein
MNVPEPVVNMVARVRDEGFTAPDCRWASLSRRPPGPARLMRPHTRPKRIR